VDWLKLSNLVMLIAATAWLTKVPDWEPLIAFISLLAAFLVQDARDFKKAHSLPDKLTHDKDLFEKYVKILSEEELMYTLENELWNLRTDMGFVRKLGETLHLSSRIEGTYLDQKLQKEFSNNVTKLGALKTFLAQHFFVPKEGVYKNGKGDFYLCLYPDLKYTDAQEKQVLYAQREQELHELIDDVINSFQSYRKQVKKTLYI
jgi:hypothetical protein